MAETGAIVTDFGRDQHWYVTESRPLEYRAGDGNDVALLAAGLPGDFDFDGDVDGSDFLLWQTDPSIGPLSDWEANYGAVATLSAASAAVPEPTTCILLAFAVITILPLHSRWRFIRPRPHSPDILKASVYFS